MPTFQVNDSKVIIDLNDFSSLLESMVQQPPIQLSQLTTHSYWIENFDFALMKNLKNNWDAPLEYVVSFFNTYCSTNIIIKKNKIYFQYPQFIFLKQQMFLLMRFCLICSLQFPSPNFKKISKFKWNSPI